MPFKNSHYDLCRYIYCWCRRKRTDGSKRISAKGKKVIILEARNRAGGRIHTLPKKHF